MNEWLIVYETTICVVGKSNVFGEAFKVCPLKISLPNRAQTARRAAGDSIQIAYVVFIQILCTRRRFVKFSHSIKGKTKQILELVASVNIE
jgi:hypothetical protein